MTESRTDKFLQYLKLRGVSPKSLKYYKSDLTSFLTWAGIKKVEPKLIQEYINSIRAYTPISTLNRRLSTLRSYESFMGFKKVSSRWKEGTFMHKLFFTHPNWYRKYHSYPVATYIHIAILVLFTSLSGYALYDQVFKNANNPLAFPTALTRSNRYMSFQGRLTSNVGNPITTATNLVFKLYTASTAGTELWTSGTCAITPDQDGIFSTLLGSSCGAEIAATVFSENASVWVGVTVAADAEATPRVQIATVAYALNSETLQGYPAGTGTSTIPYIASTGTLVLANASPKIQSTSGTFAVEGLAMTITTPNTSNGVITINPDGIGTLDLTFEGVAPGLSANGFLNATNANITSGALYGGTVASAATGYNFIDFQGGVTPASKFSVSAVGNTTIAGALTNTLATGNSLVWDTNTLIVDATNDRVGIGTTGPSVALDVTGDIEYTGTITDVSDIRLKENFEPIVNPLGIINGLQGLKFNMIGSNVREVGLIAQDVQKVLPEAVRIVDPENGYLGVSYPSLIPLVVEAIKELNSKIVNFGEMITSKVVKTDIISPIANADLIIDLQPDNSQVATQLVIKGENDEIVTSFDAEGNATISGTLYADKIESERLNAIEDLLAEASLWNTDTATASGQFTDLFVTGQTAMTSLFVSDNFTTKNINSLTDTLQIQSLAASPLEIMAGRIIIDTDGNTKFLGNVEIAGDLTINNIIVATNTSGESEPTPDVGLGEINTNATAGTAVLPAGLAELKIVNSRLKANSLIYITPVSSTQNKVLYVKSKDVGQFVIGFNEAIDTDVEFNWWIISLSQPEPVSN